jgi:hypothetical protein
MRIPRLAGGSLLALYGALASAQTPPTGRVPLTFPTDDAVLRRIWSLGMDSSQAQVLAQALLDSIGPRLTGSPAARPATG